MPSIEPRRAAQLADLAQAVQGLARDIRMYGTFSPGVVEITSLESLVLNYVGAHVAATPSQIASDVGLKSGNTSAVLRSLEHKGLVERRRDEVDGRSIRVWPTEFAERNVDAVRGDWAEMLDKYVAVDVDLVAAVETLRDISLAIGRRTPDDAPARVIPTALK